MDYYDVVELARSSAVRMGGLEGGHAYKASKLDTE